MNIIECWHGPVAVLIGGVLGLLGGVGVVALVWGWHWWRTHRRGPELPLVAPEEVRADEGLWLLVCALWSLARRPVPERPASPAPQRRAAPPNSLLDLWDIKEQIREERLPSEEREAQRRRREDEAEITREARRRLGLPAEEEHDGHDPV